MKTLRNFHFIYFTFIALLFSGILYAQDDFCGTEDEVTGGGNYFGGYLKPQRTDLTNGSPAPSNATFNIILVFIHFPNDDAYDPDWPAGEEPHYIDELLATSKNASGDFWNRYSSSTAILSDYYQEVSRGTMHVTGIARYIEMDLDNDKYAGNYTGMLEEIYDKLKNDNTINWLNFDQWKQGSNDGNFEYATDDHIDMMGLIFRRDAVGVTEAPGAAGYVPLFGPTEYQIYSNSGISKYIGRNRNFEGSGFVGIGNNGVAINKNKVLGVCIHEMGHYFFAHNHSTSGIMTSRGGVSVNDFFYSGFEKYKLGYVNTTTVNFSSSSYTLDDISGRGSNNNLTLRVPINDNEFFLMENRRKISQYDTYMLGDTSQADPFRPTGDYGKGVYIYHTMNGLDYTSHVDVECADGLWNWTFDGYQHPDWDPVNTLPILKRVSLPNPVQNDACPDFQDVANYYENADGVSTRKNGWECWFSIGKNNTTQGLSGTDKIYTNYPEYWTSRELWGDRFDAWNLGYNQIFSPYSNPNTKDASNNNTGIFIYYTGLSSNTASFSIYKATNQTELDNILAATPPSKPMIMDIQEYYDGTWCHPKIVWRQNTEPDMIRTDIPPENLTSYKRYKIYKSHKDWEGVIPNDQQFYPENRYSVIATVDVDPSTLDASFIDNNVTLYACSYYSSHPTGVSFPVRYRVQAVDNTNTTSVLSDLRQTHGRTSGFGDPEDPPSEDRPGLTASEENNLPVKYSLFQNYPNPFNPITNIQYDLPKDDFVTIKIYDIMGKEIAVIVSDFKQAGSYSVSFNGSKLGSGIYFYRIETNSFSETKRMVLVK